MLYRGPRLKLEALCVLDGRRLLDLLGWLAACGQPLAAAMGGVAPVAPGALQTLGWRLWSTPRGRRAKGTWLWAPWSRTR